MPEIQDGGRSDLMNYIREADQDLTVDSPATASILRSVEEQLLMGRVDNPVLLQESFARILVKEGSFGYWRDLPEAKFERLTQELQRDKLLVANQHNKRLVFISEVSPAGFRQSKTIPPVGEEVNTNALIDSALKSLENTNMATVDSLGYNSYLQRSESYTHESYDNPSYCHEIDFNFDSIFWLRIVHKDVLWKNMDLEGRWVGFTHKESFQRETGAPGSPQGSILMSTNPIMMITQPEHRNPPPMGGSLEDYAPPPEDGYNPSTE
ncbi:hypothetical protein BSL78_27909 [Apostichopus japonicus]|uniref:Uncharacterized protein n=1 Tax=Stichopus japonicus TaxID=307972 RepID=A0A2G8JHP3_STIJA|nr:hypothetical protein BSL78_27909 [Apostichopus japonicus]